VSSMDAEEVRPRAIAAAEKALELDDRLAEAHAAQAAVFDRLYPFDRALEQKIESGFLRALELNPNYVSAKHWYGNFLSKRHRNAEAIAQYRQALLIQPLSLNLISRLGMELLDTGQVAEGMSTLLKAAELEPWQFNVQLRLGWAFAALGRYEEANRAFAVTDQISPGNPQTSSGRAYVAALSGDVSLAQELLASVSGPAGEMDNAFLVAIVYVGLRDKEKALEWLSKAAHSSKVLSKRGFYGLDDPIYDWLRDDPRFVEIRRVALDSEGHADS